MKAPGDSTQRRVAQFVKQIAERVYESMVFELAHERVIGIDSEYELTRSLFDITTAEEPPLRGQYELTVTSVNTDGESGVCKMTLKNSNKTKKLSNLHNLNQDLMKIIYLESRAHQQENGGDTHITIPGCTEMKTMCDGLSCTFHASSIVQGRPWYDWAYVQYANDSDDGTSSSEYDTSSYFHLLVLVFVQFPGEDAQVVIRMSAQPMPWSRLSKNLILPIMLSTNFDSSYVLAPLFSIVRPNA